MMHNEYIRFCCALDKRTRQGIRIGRTTSDDKNVNVHIVRLLQESLVGQNAVASFKAERISSTLGRALRSASQHCSTVFHSRSLNPRCFAPSGFFGRIPPVTMRMIIISDGVST